MGKLMVGVPRFLLVCALGLVLTLLVPTKTLAFGESISVSPSSGPTGQAVTIVGTGWRDHAVRGIDVPIWIGFANVVGHGLPDANGNFSVGITIPVNPPPQEIVNGKLTISAIIGNGGSADAFYTIGQAPLPSNFSFNVDSTKGWQTTSLMITKGQELSFLAVGSWTVDFRYFQQVGPDGHPPDVDSTIFQGCKLESILPYGVLLVRIGDNDPQFIAIGSEETFTAYQDGFLQFRIHDRDACLADNAGSVTVAVVVRECSSELETLKTCTPRPEVPFFCLGEQCNQPRPPSGIPNYPLVSGLYCAADLVPAGLAGRVVTRFRKIVSMGGALYAVVEDVLTQKRYTVLLDALKFIPFEGCVETIADLLAPGQLDALRACLAARTPEEQMCLQFIMELIGLAKPQPSALP